MRENLIGKRFGKLTVIGFGEKKKVQEKLILIAFAIVEI